MKRYLIKPYEVIKKHFKIMKRTIKAPALPKNPDGKVYVNVGCGNDSGPEFTNVDVLTFPNIHYVHDIMDLSMFSSKSVDLLYASHVVEHIPREKLQQTLLEWKRVLKPGGTFRFSVPDFDKLIAIYQGNGSIVDVVRDQVLGQKPPYDNHYTLWNEAYARTFLGDLGFVDIRLWSPDTVDHHNFSDRSSRAISVQGVPVPLSLNIQANVS